jgi:hypothetical protein
MIISRISGGNFENVSLYGDGFVEGVVCARRLSEVTDIAFDVEPESEKSSN